MVKELIDTYYKTHEFTAQASLFIADPSLLPELVDVSTSELPHPYPEHASWLLVHISDLESSLLETYEPVLIDKILVTKNQSVLRNLLNVSTKLPLIEHRQAEFLDKLIEIIQDESNKVAAFVYAIYKLVQFTLEYPEIKQEILGIIEMKQSLPIQPSIKIGIRNYLKATKNIT